MLFRFFLIGGLLISSILFGIAGLDYCKEAVASFIDSRSTTIKGADIE